MNHSQCNYTYAHYKKILETGINHDYRFKTCYDFLITPLIDQKVCVLRHDVDASPERSYQFAKIESDLGVRASYFFRVHANDYNCFGYETICLIKDLDNMGHEIGLHAEPIDIQKASQLDSHISIRLGKEILENIIGKPIMGVASHNDLTPDNNLDFFKSNAHLQYGFSYEAYDENLKLFNHSFYITDSHPWYWRTFIEGKLVDEHHCLCKYFQRSIPTLYCLTHPNLWYRTHYHRVRY